MTKANVSITSEQEREARVRALATVLSALEHETRDVLKKSAACDALYHRLLNALGMVKNITADRHNVYDLSHRRAGYQAVQMDARRLAMLDAVSLMEDAARLAMNGR